MKLGTCVLIPTPAPGLAERVELPGSRENLFSRIIRDPRPAGRAPRERECAEMLAGVLLATTSTRDAILDSFAEALEQPPPCWDEVELRIETEQPVEGKRDDLRIQALHPETGEPLVLWTVEVKVGSGFHSSGPVEGAVVEEAADQGAEVHQLVNYDAWLEQQPHTHKAGVVLAVTDKTDSLPAGLAICWRCVTWGQVASTVIIALELEQIPPGERLIARHLAGFILQNLASGAEMSDNRFTFDHIAFLRAVRVLASETNAVADTMVAPLAGLIEKSEIGVGKVTHQKKVVEGHQRSVVWQYLYGVERSPYIMAGVVTDGGVDVAVWIESAPRHQKKAGIAKAAQEHLDALRAYDSRWTVSPDRDWWDLEVRMPLTSLLHADDQAAAIMGFASQAVRALKETGLLDALGRAVAQEE